MSQVVLRQHVLFIEAEVARDSANKTTVEDAAGEFLPVLIFHRVEESRADARGSANLFERNLAHFALTLQAIAKRTFGHEIRAGRESEAAPGFADPYRTA